MIETMRDEEDPELIGRRIERVGWCGDDGRVVTSDGKCPKCGGEVEALVETDLARKVRALDRNRRGS